MSRFKTEIWEKFGGRRRLALLLLVAAPSLLSAQILYSMLPRQGLLGLNLLVTILFAVLFSWISVGFWSSLAGMIVLLTRYDRFKATLSLGETHVPPGFKTALLFPVYHEDMKKALGEPDDE